MTDAPTTADILDVMRRARRVQSAVSRGAPKRMGDVISQLLARRGYAQVKSSGELLEAWRKAAGSFASATAIGACRGGVLRVSVANSAVMQGMMFSKQAILVRRWA